MDESEGREVWFLNRDLLVVRPKEPYIEWARTVYDDEPITDEEARDWVDAFLLPECDTQEEALDWIAENCDVIFELMLADWVVEPEAWPEDRGWEVFQRWFTFERIETTWDLVDAPLSSDPPLPETDAPFN